MKQATQRPWRIARNYADRLYVVGANNDGKTTTSDRVCNLPHRKNGEGEANASLIVSAVNEREALLEIEQAARDVADHGQEDPTRFFRLNQALARLDESRGKA